MKKLLHATQTLLSLLACTLLFAGCNAAFAEEVAVAETAPAVEAGGPDSLDFSSPRSGGDLAMLYYVPAVPADKALGSAPAATRPLQLQAASGADTRLGVDVASINETAEREGWPTWAKVTVIIGGVAVVSLAAWAIVEATQHHGDHTSGDDSSIHLPIEVNGDGNQVHVTWDSPSTSSTRNGY